MKIRFHNLTNFLAVAALSGGLAACGDTDKSGAEEAAAPANLDPRIEAVILESEPADAVSVVEARKDPKPGVNVTVTGRIAGVDSPFSADYATLVLADQTLKTCDLDPADSCSTPWDACCEPSDEIKKLRLTIQVLDESGKPVAQSLKGANGLKEMDDLVVTGTVAEGSTAENVIINATGLYKKPS